MTIGYSLELNLNLTVQLNKMPYCNKKNQENFMIKS